VEINRSGARGRWELPTALQLTSPEKLAEAEAAQRDLARTSPSPFANLSPASAARGRAARVIPELEDALKRVEKQMGRVFTAGGAESFEELQEAQKVIWRQLAEAHAATGRFDRAAHYEYDPAEKYRYQRIWRAVWRRDDYFCGCPPTNAGHPQFFVVADIFSVKHGREMVLVKCGACKCLNVTTNREVLKPLQEQRAHRKAAAALVGGAAPADAAKTLRIRNHTTRELLK
jgi:hypothetical protein